MKSMIKMDTINIATIEIKMDPIVQGGIAVAAASAITYMFAPAVKEVKEFVGCTTGSSECCKPKWLTRDVYALSHDLNQHLFGQHIVQHIVPSVLYAHIHSQPEKPLVMSFHGWPGSGKNYVVQFIADKMFLKGTESKFFHFFNGRIDFPLEGDRYHYQEQLRTWIRTNVTLCPSSMFVFDEVDKMPNGILDGIKPYLDYHNVINGISYRDAIFIFLSNTGGNIIVDRYLELWRKLGKSRHEMTLNDFHSVIEMGAFNEKGGLHMSDVVDHSLIDHYVPFLPLEAEHIKQCIKVEFEKHGHHATSKDDIEEIMKVIVFGPKPERLFATSGCKRISQKVSAIVHKKSFEKRQLDGKQLGEETFFRKDSV